MKKALLAVIMLVLAGACFAGAYFEGSDDLAAGATSATYTVPASLDPDIAQRSQLRLVTLTGVLSTNATAESTVTIYKVKTQTVSGSLVTNDIAFASGTITSNGTALAISVSNIVPVNVSDTLKFGRDANSTNAVLYLNPVFEYTEY